MSTRWIRKKDGSLCVKKDETEKVLEGTNETKTYISSHTYRTPDIRLSVHVLRNL